MDRRDFLRSTGSVAAAAAAVGPVIAPANAGQSPKQEAPVSAASIGTATRELGLAFDWPDNDQGLADSARRLAQRVFDLTEGRIRVVVRSGADAAAAEMRHGVAHDHLAANPAFAYFAGLPGSAGMAAADLETWLSMAGGQLLWDELAAEQGAKSLLAGYSGSAPLLWSRGPITSIADVTGKRIACLGLGAEVLRGIGAEPIEMTSKNYASAMTAGGLDGVEWGSTMHAHVLELPTVARHASGPLVNRFGTAQSLDIKSEIWSGLSKADQAAIAAATVAEFRQTASEARLNEAMARKVATLRNQTVFSEAGFELTGAIDRVAEAVVAHGAGANRMASRINASYMAFRALIPSAGPPVA
jgi:TRAP-type mannitol/chloroaromatic compound transport system substrate-binding protein